MLDTATSMKNAYIEIYHWVKGEIYDIQAMKDVMAAKKIQDEQTRKL